jgi:hypothetical protein
VNSSIPIPTYPDLLQLQCFIFEASVEEMLLRQGHRGYRGIRVFIKLSDTHMLPFRWPFPEDHEDKCLALPVHPDIAASSVILIDIGIEVDVLHAAIVRIGLGHHLLNLEG